MNLENVKLNKCKRAGGRNILLKIKYLFIDIF